MNRRKVTAIVLVLALLLTLLPVTALAAVHEHTWRRSDSKSVKATCTKKGKIVYVCSCGKTKTESVPATGHSWGKWKTTTEATCDHAGEQVRKCGKCGQKETRKLDRKSHSWGKWKTTKQATCVQNGEQTRKCGKCGKKEKRKTDKIAHSWGKWTTSR